MFNKRIAGIVAGTALAASAVFVPVANAQTSVEGGTVYEITTNQGDIKLFVADGQTLITLEQAYDPSNNATNCHAGREKGRYNLKQVTAGKVTIGDEEYFKLSDRCNTGGNTEPNHPDDPNKPEDPDKPGASTPGSSDDLIDGSSDLSSGSSDDEDGSSDAAGSALLGLSALAGSALLSSGGSSAIPDGDGSGPGSSDEDAPAPAPAPGDDSEGPAQGPVDSPDSKATGQQPATGPVGGQDPKAVAQAQAANAPAAAPAKAAPAAQQAAPAPAAQQQLANTGVQGTLIALAAGLAAIAAGALLVLRRRA